MKAQLLVMAVVLPMLAGCVSERGGDGPDQPDTSASKPGLTGASLAGEESRPVFQSHEGIDLSQVVIENITIPSFDGVYLHATIFKPPNASPVTPVPVIFHTPYWSGHRWIALTNTDDPVDGGFENINAGDFLQYGFGVISVSQRGLPESDGTDTWWDAETMGNDHDSLFDFLAGLDWVAQTAPGDPIVGGLGGSYGAVGQVLAALWQTQQHGATRYDALAPFSFPYDTFDAMFPGNIPNAFFWEVIVRGLGESRMIDRDPTFVAIQDHQSVAGKAPDGSSGTPDAGAYMAKRSPSTFIDQGVKLDVPVLAMGGMQDTWFTPDGAMRLYAEGITSAAMADSRIFMQRVAHTVPGYQDSPYAPCEVCRPEPCGSVWAFAVQWYRELWYGLELGLGPKMQVAAEDECIGMTKEPLLEWQSVAVSLEVMGPSIGRLGSPALAKAKLADGPLLLAGRPMLNATLTGDDGAAIFIGIAVEGPDGTRIVGDQWAPYRLGSGSVELGLAGIATRVDPGEAVYLVATSYVDRYGRANIQEGLAMTVEGIEIGLPIVNQ